MRTHLGFALFAWVIMPEHVHLLVRPSPPEITVPRILMGIKRPVATEILANQRACGADSQARFWQPGGGYDRNIFSNEELIEKINYIHQNPVRRGLVDRPEDWVWSSARAYAGLPTQWSEIDHP